MTRRYGGGEDANGRRVARYLLDNYEGVTEVQAVNLVTKYLALVEDGERMRSFANYVGDKIAVAEGLTELPEIEEDEE